MAGKAPCLEVPDAPSPAHESRNDLRGDALGLVLDELPSETRGPRRQAGSCGRRLDSSGSQLLYREKLGRRVLDPPNSRISDQCEVRRRAELLPDSLDRFVKLSAGRHLISQSAFEVRV